MAGIGFELRKAIEQGTPAKRFGAYVGAAFSSSGSMLVGIFLFVLIQTTAKRHGVTRETADIFMCYVTNMMFLSMLLVSAVSLPLARYVSNLLYLKRHERVLPSLIGGLVLTAGLSAVLMLPLYFLSDLDALTGLLLFIFLLVLNACWLLMTYITLLRDYRQIVAAFLLSLCVSASLLSILTLADALTLPTMILLLLCCFAVVDMLLFRALSRSFPHLEGSVFAFLEELRANPSLACIGLFLSLGMLGHFWLVWFLSGHGRRVDSVFRFGPNYDFPAIVAYFSTIPAAIYFVTLFETRFSERYQQYFRLLGHSGTVSEVHAAKGRMFEALYRGFRAICSLQLAVCLFAVTVGAKLLNVMNIGMTLDMLNTFRMFCVGYSLYYLGTLITLLQLYFMNERRVFASALFFAVGSNLATWLCFRLTDAWGMGFSLVSLLWAAVSCWQLVRYLSKLEYNALGRQRTALPRAQKEPARRQLRIPSRWNRYVLSLSILAVLSCSTVLAGQAYQEKRILHFSPAGTDAVLRSPGMGLAPWAENEETLAMDTTLVYVELTWAEWEPEEGVYAVDYVNEEFNLEEYRSEGRQVVFRFICDEPQEGPEDEPHRDIPGWLYELTADGDSYCTENGFGYSPDYTNELLIEKHRQAIHALGEAFGKDDFFCYVELGSLGHWGEWNTDFQNGVRRLPDYSVRERYIQPYLTAFPNAFFLLRYPLMDAVIHDFGLYNDLTGDYDETKYWMEQMQGGVWEQTGLEEQAVCTDIWKTRPVGGEFSPLVPDRSILIDNFNGALEGIVDSHQSFIGPKIIVDESDNKNYSMAVDEILRHLGYRLRVSAASVDFTAKDRFTVACTVTNDGIAPIYQPYQMQLSLYNEEYEPVWESDETDFDLRAVLPGEEHELRFTLSRDEFDDDSRYLLCAAIVDQAGKAAVPMAMPDTVGENIYTLGSFTLPS